MHRGVDCRLSRRAFYSGSSDRTDFFSIEQKEDRSRRFFPLGFQFRERNGRLGNLHGRDSSVNKCCAGDDCIVHLQRPRHGNKKDSRCQLPVQLQPANERTIGQKVNSESVCCSLALTALLLKSTFLPHKFALVVRYSLCKFRRVQYGYATLIYRKVSMRPTDD